MAQTKIFRDRVVSLEQTQEIGEKYLDLLTELALDALPGFERVDYTLEHEADLFCLVLKHPASGRTKRVSFTRMFLSDAGRLPAVVEDPNGPVRARIIELIRGQAARDEIAVTLRQLLTEEEQVEAEAIDAEWRKKQEALLAAKRAEEERRAREKKRLRQIEEQRRAEKRKREKQAGRERQARGEKRPAQPQGAPQAHQPRGERRPQKPPQGERRPQPAPGEPRAQGTRPEAAAHPASAEARPPSSQGPAGEARPGGRRRRRRHRGRGAGAPQQGGAPHAGDGARQG